MTPAPIIVSLFALWDRESQIPLSPRRHKPLQKLTNLLGKRS